MSLYAVGIYFIIHEYNCIYIFRLYCIYQLLRYLSKLNSFMFLIRNSFTFTWRKYILTHLVLSLRFSPPENDSKNYEERERERVYRERKSVTLIRSSFSAGFWDANFADDTKQRHRCVKECWWKLLRNRIPRLFADATRRCCILELFVSREIAIDIARPNRNRKILWVLSRCRNGHDFMTFHLHGGNVTLFRRASLFFPLSPRLTYWSAFFYDYIPRAIKKCYSRGSLDGNSSCRRIEAATGMKFAIVSI